MKLQILYGGYKFHIKSNEKYKLDTKDNKYITLNDLKKEFENTTALTTNMQNLMSNDSASITRSVSNLSIKDSENNISVIKKTLSKKQNLDDILVRK